MYRKLEEIPRPESTLDDAAIPADPCTCACREPVGEGKEEVVAADFTAVQGAVYYDING